MEILLGCLLPWLLEWSTRQTCDCSRRRAGLRLDLVDAMNYTGNPCADFVLDRLFVVAVIAVLFF